jgi:hypothetical protein
MKRIPVSQAVEDIKVFGHTLIRELGGCKFFGTIRIQGSITYTARVDYCLTELLSCSLILVRENRVDSNI